MIAAIITFAILETAILGFTACSCILARRSDDASENSAKALGIGGGEIVHDALNTPFRERNNG